MKIPYIALYPEPFIADTYHLGNTELGIYWRLLLHYYQHLQPLPYDLDQVCRIAYATSPEERKAVEFILTKFFTPATDGEGNKVWRNHRADEEIERALERVELNQSRTKAATKARRKVRRPIQRDVHRHDQRDDVRDVKRNDKRNEGEREREILDQDLDIKIKRERVEGGTGGDSTSPSLSQNKLINKKGKVPKEWIELAVRERPDLPRDHFTKIMGRRFEITYQDWDWTVRQDELFKKWLAWLVTEEANGTNGNGQYKRKKQLEKEERKRKSDLDREQFLAKGKGKTNGVTHEEIPSHERY